uniref:EGF-like domain-containing protein n=1 Tax=Mola mola TaxID=94237 RepID=A0A3Q3VRW5_MOLML
MDDDVLLPYANGHGPSHSHRYVRDCQPALHGNITHESWPSSNHTSDHTHVMTVSVLEPGGPGGCGMNQRATVEETASAAGCLYAQNGGFFNTKSNWCLGNVVSDGRMVQDSGGVQNAQFGIRRDGTLVFGYLSQDEVSDHTNPFVQLFSGVVWLLRNGEVYINQSLVAECDKTQETGLFRTFVNVVSARTAVGHDTEGKLILFQIDGQTGVRGMSLWEVAEFLKKNGVINAINLDGGGSSTYVIDGSLASYPSDHCVPDGRWRCGRRVSTILCVHPRHCQPVNCNGHGDCVDGRCSCHEGWQGVACDTLVCQSPACGHHGVCTVYGCVCDAGWRGKNCSQVCPLGFFGPSCTQECCYDDICPCDPQTGSCNTTVRKETNYTLHKGTQTHMQLILELLFTQKPLVNTRGERGRQAEEKYLQGMSSLWDSWGSRQQRARQAICGSGRGGKNPGVGGVWGGHGTRLPVGIEGLLANCPAA